MSAVFSGYYVDFNGYTREISIHSTEGLIEKIDSSYSESFVVTTDELIFEWTGKLVVGYDHTYLHERGVDRYKVFIEDE